MILTKKVTNSKHHRLVTNIEKGYAFIKFLKITFKMKKGMLFSLSHRERRVKKMNLLHFPIFASKNFVILILPEPSTNS